MMSKSIYPRVVRIWGGGLSREIHGCQVRSQLLWKTGFQSVQPLDGEHVFLILPQSWWMEPNPRQERTASWMAVSMSRLSQQLQSPQAYAACMQPLPRNPQASKASRLDTRKDTGSSALPQTGPEKPKL